MISSVGLNLWGQKPDNHAKIRHDQKSDSTINNNLQTQPAANYNKKNLSNYEIRTTTYNKKGYHQEMETAISLDSLPKPARLYIEKNYPDYKIGETSVIVDEKGDITYEAELRKHHDAFELEFDKKGKFITREPAD